MAITNAINHEMKEKFAIEHVFQSRGRIKILKILATEGELNISEIARKAHINHNSTRHHLNFLVKANILQEKTFGRIRIYRFRIENTKVRAIKNLFDIWENSNL
ncbi:MAG: winged helix-turn-helix transcriptional regulator [Candidatus Helarchaeota archaeon]|nr:winged helix-turn-helix transcriptional regulator [Candidatus Helarchaeota archaeon]